MRNGNATTLVASSIAIFAFFALVACAPMNPPEFGPFVGSRGDANTIVEDQVRASGARSAYDVIARIHPRFLSSQVELGGANQRDVYLDGVPLSGIEELRTIPASAVKEIHFIRAIDGGGSGREVGAAIWVVSKARR